MDFGEVLSKAWRIIWKHKILWIFGILAGCGQAASSGGGNLGAQASNQNAMLPWRIQQFVSRVETWQWALIIAAILLFVLILIVIVVILGTVGWVGLIRGTQLAEQGAERLEFGQLFREGLKYFWRVFGLNLLVVLAAIVVISALVLPGILLTVVTFGIFGVCMIPLICLLVPVAWAAAIWIEQSIVALVVEDIGIFAALKRAWGVCKSHLGEYLVMGLILVLGIGLLGGIVIGAPMALIVAPAFIGMALGTQTALRAGMIVAVLFFVAYLPILLVLSGILRAYISSAWTLTYLRLRGEPLAALPAEPAAESLPDPATGA